MDSTSHQVLVVLALSLMPLLSQAVSVGSTTQGSNTGSATLTFSHTPGSGSNRLLIVAISVGSTALSGASPAPTVTSVTYNGVAMTLVDDALGSESRIVLYRLVNPAAGPFNVVVTVSSATNVKIDASATTFTGVDQSTPLDMSVVFESAASVGSISLTVGSTASDLIYSATAIDEGTVDQGITTDAGQTELWNTSGVNYTSAASSYEAGTGSNVTSLYTYDNAQDHSGIIVAIKQVVQLTFPGGVASNNPLWLKANAGTSSTTDGAAVTTWTNSAAGAEMSTASAGLIPLYRVTSSNQQIL